MVMYSVFNALFPKCVAHKKKSCVYIGTLPYINSLPLVDRIESQLAYFLNQLISLLISKPSSTGRW